jgi:C1A family cysteine protease
MLFFHKSPFFKVFYGIKAPQLEIFMQKILGLALLILSIQVKADIPSAYRDLLPYVQAAPDQGDTNTCWFVASTGVMELLLNRRDGIKYSVTSGKNDLSESFLIWQADYVDRETYRRHWLESIVLRFNHGAAIHHKEWPFNAYLEDGSMNQEVWWKHPKFDLLERLQVPQVKTKMLFSIGNRWATDVLDENHLQQMKEALITHQSPLIVNYNDDGYWHVVLIVGYSDKQKGSCYQIDPIECQRKGSFYVRDSNGKKYEARSYSWFLRKGNAAAVVEMK